MAVLFISHQGEPHKALAERLKTLLEERGYENVFVDRPDLRAGNNFVEQIHSHIRQCAAVIVLLSEAAARSAWVQHEWLLAQYLKRFVLPIKLDNQDPPAWAGPINAFYGGEFDDEELCDEIVAKLSVEGFGPSELTGINFDKPFAGSRPLDSRRTGLFFGRDEEVNRIVNALKAGVDKAEHTSGRRSPVFVVGPSGCGKSSILRARVAPRLRAGLRNATIKGPVTPEEGIPVDVAFPGILMIDQFEQLISRLDFSEQQTFVQSVEALAERGIIILAALRSSFEDNIQKDCGSFFASADKVRIEPFSKPELEELVRLYERRFNWQFDAGAISELVEKTGANLPLLSFALERIRRPRANSAGHGYAPVTLPEVENLFVGRAGDVLYERAASELVSLDDLDKPGFRAAVLDMVQLTEIGAVTRSAERANLQPDVVVLLDNLSPDLVHQEAHDRYEFSHDAIVQGWPRISAIINMNRDFLELRKELEAASSKQDFLWPAPKVRKAEETLSMAPEGYLLGVNSRSFLERSRDAARAGEDAIRKQVRLRRGLFFSLVAALFAIVLLGGFYVQRSSLNEALEEVRQGDLEASSQRFSAAAEHYINALAHADLPGPKDSLKAAQVRRTLHRLDNDDKALAESPDGSWIVRVEGIPAARVIAIQRRKADVPSFRAEFIESDKCPRMDHAPGVDIDNAGTAAWVSSRLLHIRTAKGAERVVRVPEPVIVCSVTISSKGVVIAQDSEGALWAAANDATTATRVTDRDTDAWAFSPDGKWLAATAGSAIELYDTENWGRQPERLADHNDSVLALLFDRDGDRLISAGWDRRIVVWKWVAERKRFEVDFRISHRLPEIGALAVDPRGQQVAAVSFNSLNNDNLTCQSKSDLILLHRETLEPIERLGTESCGVRRLHVRPQATGTVYSTISASQHIKRLEASSFSPLGSTFTLPHQTYTASWMAPPAFISATSIPNASAVHRWTATTSIKAATPTSASFQIDPDLINRMKKESENKGYAKLIRVTSSDNGAAVAVSFDQGHVIAQVGTNPPTMFAITDKPRDSIWDLRFMPGSSDVLAVAGEQGVLVKKLRDSQVMYRYPTVDSDIHNPLSQGVAFSRDGIWFVWGDQNGNLGLVHTGEKWVDQPPLLKHVGTVWKVAACGEGEAVKFAAAGGGGSVSVWRLTDALAQKKEPHYAFATDDREEVYNIKFSRDCRYLAWGYASGRVALLKVGTDVPSSTRINLPLHTAPIWDLDFSPDGHRLLVISDDGLGNVLDVDKIFETPEVRSTAENSHH